MKLAVSLGGSALVLLAMLGTSTNAAAWEGLTSSNPRWTGTVPYALHEAGSADLGGFEATQAVVREGFEDWTRVTCSGLTTNYQGATAAPLETRNTIAWAESSWPYDPNAIGVTTPRFSTTEVVDAAMLMNGVNFTWTTGAGSGTQVNAYSIITHESGHYLGLGHSSDSNSMMYFAYSGGVSAINGDDENGICTLYPGGGGGATDCTTTGCPAGQSCTDGRCVAGAGGTGGAGATCDGCTSDSDCSGSCLRYPDDLGYCGDVCSSDADCGGSNEVCQSVSDGTTRCIRRRAADGSATCSIDAGTAPTGPGPAPGECTSSRDCEDSERCDAEGTCIPVETAGAVGDACGTNTDCASGLCAVDSSRDQSFCTRICTAHSECPGGYACEAVGGDMSACTPTGGGGTGTGLAGDEARLASGVSGGCSATHLGGLSAGNGFAVAFALMALAGVRRRRRG